MPRSIAELVLVLQRAVTASATSGRPHGAVNVNDELGRLPREQLDGYVAARELAPLILKAYGEVAARLEVAHDVIEAGLVAFVDLGDADDPIAAAWAVVANRSLSGEEAAPPAVPAGEGAQDGQVALDRSKLNALLPDGRAIISGVLVDNEGTIDA